MNERKPLPKPLQWPWCLILYAAALVALRLFGVLVIVAVEAVRRRYSPHGVQEGYCLARTRKKLIRLAGGLPLLALAAACFWLSRYAPEEEKKELLMVLAMGAAALLIGLWLTYTAVRDAFFPARSKLAASIRSQLDHPDEAPPVAQLFAMVDGDLQANGIWFGPVAVGRAWVLGEEANYIPRICGVYTIDRMVRGAGGKRTREMALVLIDDRFQLHRTDYRAGPQDLQAAADAIALRAPDAVRGVNDDYQKLLWMDDGQKEQFLQQRRRNQGQRAAAAAQADRDAGPDQDMTLTLADGTATSRLTDEQVQAALLQGLAGGEETVFFLTPSRPLTGGGPAFSELEVRLRPEQPEPVELLLKLAPETGVPTAGYLRAFLPEDAEPLLLAWCADRVPDVTGWQPVRLLTGVRTAGEPQRQPPQLWLEDAQGLHQQFTDFSADDVEAAAAGLADGAYRSVAYHREGGFPFFVALAGDETDGRCRVQVSVPAGRELQVRETKMSARQAAGALRQFQAGTLTTDRSWKDVTGTYFKD